MKFILLIIGCCLSCIVVCAQDTITPIPFSLAANEQAFQVGKGKTLVYKKQKPFSFITNIPRDFASIAKASVQRNAIKPWIFVAASSAALIAIDQALLDGVVRFSDKVGLERKESYNNVLSIGSADLIKLPRNLNTGIYQLGQGFPSLLISGGLFLHGKIKNDYRSLSTANQLAETFVLMGVYTQIIKRTTGRETPDVATQSGGKWRPFPSFGNYQSNTPFYDAFPSGHMATMISTITILNLNYPEMRWIKPVGYSIAGLVGFAMMNNKVHWAGDYPMAFALGYLCAKQVVKRHQRIIEKGVTAAKKSKAVVNYGLENSYTGQLMPKITVTF